MIDPTFSFRDRAGRVEFPRSTADLTSTSQCPACFTPLSSQICTTCGLDLANPLAAELAEVSLDAAENLERRLELIGQIRVESTTAARVPDAVPAVLDVPVAVPVAAASATPAARPIHAPQPTSPAAPMPVAPPRRQLSVQVVLLLVGVALLSIGAIFFLVYAFITFGLVWRSLIIGTVTVAAFVGATLLRRRSLTASAESVAILAVVLTYLDSFAVRANNLLVVGDDGGLVHWGATLLVTAVGFLVWHRFSSLRVPSIVGFAAIPPGLALLVGGLTEGIDVGVRIFSVALAIAIGGLAHPLAGRISRPRTPGRAERAILLVFTIIGISVAAIVALVITPTTTVAPLIALLIVAAASLAHVDIAVRTGAPTGFVVVIAGIGAISAASAVAATAARVDSPAFTVTMPLLAAAVVALGLEYGFRRATGPTRVAWLGATIAATAVATVAALVTVTSALSPLARAFSPRIWWIPANAPLGVRSEHVLAIAALAAVIGLTALAWWAGGRIRARGGMLLWAGLVVLVIAVPLTNLLWAAVGGWMLIGIGGMALVLARRTWAPSTRIPLAAGAGAATLLGYFSSWTSEDIWLLGSLGALAVLVLARFAVTNPITRGSLVGAGTIVALITAASWGSQLQSVVNAPDRIASIHAVAALAVVLLAASALLCRALHSIETRVLFWIPLLTAAVTGGMIWVGWGARVTSSVEAGISTVVAAGFVAVICLWLFLPRTTPFVPERIAASVALAPTLAWLFSSLASAADAPPAIAHLAPVGAAVVAAAFSLARAAVPSRWARDVGIAGVTVVAVGASPFAASGIGWLIVVLSAVVVLLLAVSPDGLFASTNPRKYLGWLALALATAGVSWALADAGVQDVAAYVLPPAAALLVVALLTRNAARRTDEPSAAAPWIGLGGLLVGILPIAVTAIDESSARLFVIAVVSAALFLIGSLIARGMPLRPYLDALAFAGAAGLLIAAGGRAWVLALGGAAGLEVVLWLAALLLVFAVSAVGQARIAARVSAGQTAREIISQALLVAPMFVILVVGANALRSVTAPEGGAFALVVLFSALHVVCGIIDRIPFTRVVSWIAIGFAGATWLVGLGVNQLDPIEWGTVPVAVALLITGAVVLRREPAARSWPWLAPGILVLILPSLVTTFTDQPIWRLVAIGVACILAIIAGAVLRLQAPLVLGSALVLVHGLRTFAPQIIAVYQLTQWWVWAVVGGAIIFFIGFTFEKRKRDFQKATAKIAGLR